jgi:hypothetical protein
MKVPGKKHIPKMEIVFIAELSRLLALAITAEVSARLRFIFASFAAMNW